MITYSSGITVIMPIYNQGSFLKRAIVSLLNQTFLNWELIIINDGSTDNSAVIISEFLDKEYQVKYVQNEKNKGLGFCLNKGIREAKFDYIAYLPADDIYFNDHLLTLYNKISSLPQAVLAYSGIKFNYQDSSYTSKGNVTTEKVKGQFQLVQVLHRKTEDQWVERKELVTDDLNLMFWHKLTLRGESLPTTRVSAEWVWHPTQRHRIINEQYGGNIFLYKSYFNVKTPIVFQSSGGIAINEINAYAGIKHQVLNPSARQLKILIVGEIAYNAERICALEERGHKLFALWIENPLYYNTTGPLQFGNVTDIPLDNWQERIAEIKPDIIYALLNVQAVTLAHQILTENPGIPFIWHFKEGPFFCRQQGIWNELVDLYQKSDGQIYINSETQQWFGQFLSNDDPNSFILDGDLPHSSYFKTKSSDLLSQNSDEIHTVVPGRPFGLIPKDVLALAEQNIHLHLYGNQKNTYSEWLKYINDKAKNHIHLHDVCQPAEWTQELSQYDAGWLHIFDSSNFGEYARMEWPDLNYPARISTLAAAGLPMIQKNNAIHTVATQSLTKKMDIGVFYSTFEELGDKLKNKKQMKILRDNCWNQRLTFSFDYHADDLISFFYSVIDKYNMKKHVSSNKL